MRPHFFSIWLRRFLPAPIAINWKERLRACCGALIGIVLTAFLTHQIYPIAELPWLIAPMGASAVLLFAVPASPLAQPWSIIGGNIIAAIIGVTCAKYIDIELLALACAIAGTITGMFILRCIHPPAGAVTLTAVLGGPAIHAAGYGFVWMPVAVNSILLLLVALIFHASTRHSYPHVAHKSAHTPNNVQFGFTSDDLDLALRDYNELLDIDRNDLETILHDAEANAYRRRFGKVTCASVMTRAVISVNFGDSLEHAWQLLCEHDIKALPVIDRSRRVVGIITQADFLKHAGLANFESLVSRVSAFVKRVRTLHSDKPEVVGQIMTRRVMVASEHKSVAELVPLFADAGYRHIPIVDAELRLVGIVTLSDLILALYSERANETIASNFSA